MAYSTQNMYQMFDIIPNFVRKMFPFSLKSYPSCTNTMAWDIRDEIRSAYILRMVHQRDNQRAMIDDNERDNDPFRIAGRGGDYRLPTKEEALISSSQLILTPIDQSIIQPKSTFRGDFPSSDIEKRLSSETIHLVASTPNIDLLENPNTENLIACEPTLQREYQLLAQKFHQYTINCKTTIRTLEKRLKKLIDDKHALLHDMVTVRKEEKDVIKKYRKMFNDAMNEHSSEINALVANYKIIRDNYLELLQHDTSFNDRNRNEEVLSVSYTSYNCS